MAEVENQPKSVRPGDQSVRLYNKIKEIYGDELEEYPLNNEKTKTILLKTKGGKKLWLRGITGGSISINADGAPYKAVSYTHLDDFRSHLKNACPECKHRSNCMGGCPICPEIVLCDAHERKV